MLRVCETLWGSEIWEGSDGRGKSRGGQRTDGVGLSGHGEDSAFTLSDMRIQGRVLSREIFSKVMQKWVETRKLLGGCSNNPDNGGGLDREQWGWLCF